MKVFFHINYCTTWGETVAVRFLQSDGTEKYLYLSTIDGMNWRGQCDFVGDVEYSYGIYKESKPIRLEDVVANRYLYDDSSNRTFYVFDAWRDRSSMPYYYSSALQWIRNDHGQKKLIGGYNRALILYVSVPQIKDRDNLVLCGNQECMGNWSPDKGLKLYKTVGSQKWGILLDASEIRFPIEYKYCLYNKKTGETKWEESDNHVVESIDVCDNETYVFDKDIVYFSFPSWKSAGVAIPVFSLRTEQSFGVGDFGDLKLLVDWAELTHQHIIQILPINDTTRMHTWKDSYPYSAISIYAIHPMYINLPALGKLKDAVKVSRFETLQKKLSGYSSLDYEQVNNAKWEYIKEMFNQNGREQLDSDNYKKFFLENKEWLIPYAAFCYLRDREGTADFAKWKEFSICHKEKVEALCAPESKCYGVVSLYFYVQYHLHLQLLEAANYARHKHIVLKGDIPIGVSRDSVETWTEPRYFNKNGQAGAPPDEFSKNGQNWGFPTYNWEEMAEDGYMWWIKRLKHMEQYFDAYRIDHVLGFFRIWEIPASCVYGLLGQFVPSIPMSISEIESYGLSFNRELLIMPYINDWVLLHIFGSKAEEVKSRYLKHGKNGLYELLPQFDTERKVEKYFCDKIDKKSIFIKEGLYKLISDVLFVRDKDNLELFHPRIIAQSGYAFNMLIPREKEAFNRLYNDYYYYRHNNLWHKEAMKKLPLIIGSSRMLACGEDLGMVPQCVGEVMNELHILSLEIQRMPKEPYMEFGQTHQYPYCSVCTFSSHDTSTLRGWWMEDTDRTEHFFHNELELKGKVPKEATADICEKIINNQLGSASMLCILTLQDWLSIDQSVRCSDVEAERINVPSDSHHYWRYRMHVTIESLLKNKALNNKICMLINSNDRYE